MSIPSDNHDELTILYQDDHLVAINKPAGLLVHRSAIDKRETRFALQLLRDQLGSRVFPVHRLDKPTCGVLLFARDADTARSLMPAFQQGKVRKEYLALVRGYTDETGVIDYALKEQPDKMTDADADADKPAQPARSSYLRLHTVELPYPVGRYASARYSLLRLRPHTGRKHQLRRHMKHIFHPIVGDTTHGDGRHNRFFREHFRCHQLLLCAERLQLEHPLSKESLDLRCAPGDGFADVLAQLNCTQYLLGRDQQP